MKSPAPENPYIAARLEWNERYHGFLRAKRNWQLIALALVVANSALCAGLVWLGGQSRVVPYVVEVDRLGAAIAVGPADRAVATTNPALVRYQLVEFIRRVRSVVGDGAAEKQLLEAAYHQASGAAVGFLNEHFQAQSPFARAREHTVSIAVTSVLAMPSSDSWQIEWTETQRGLDGALHREERWKALVRVEVRGPESAEEIAQNPLGLYVSDIQWTKQL